MHRVFRLAMVTILGATTVSLSRGPADIKADMQRMMPVGCKEIRLAWIKGGNFTEFAQFTNHVGVYVVSSVDGVVKKIYPPSGTGNFYNVNLSANGNRVFFYNHSSGNACVINFDGTGFKEIDVGGVAEYWCNPADKSDWLIVNYSRVKVDDPETKVEIFSGDFGFALSDNGQLGFGHLYNWEPAVFGLENVSSLKWTPGPHGGCQGSLSAGTSPKYSHNPSGHGALCVHETSDQEKFVVYPTVDSIMPKLESKGLKITCDRITSEGARFTQHPEYISFYMSSSKANPILMHIPDMKFMYVEDDLPCGWSGDMDAVFLVNSSGLRPTAPGHVLGTRKKQQSSKILYSLSGRQIRSSASLESRGRPGHRVVLYGEPRN